MRGRSSLERNTERERERTLDQRINEHRNDDEMDVRLTFADVSLTDQSEPEQVGAVMTVGWFVEVLFDESVSAVRHFVLL